MSMDAIGGAGGIRKRPRFEGGTRPGSHGNPMGHPPGQGPGPGNGPAAGGCCCPKGDAFSPSTELRGMKGVKEGQETSPNIQEMLRAMQGG